MKTYFTNLRTDGEVLRPVGRPVAHYNPASLRPLCRIGDKLLLGGGTELTLGAATADAGAEVLCAACTGAGEAVVMTAAGARRVRGAGSDLTVDSLAPEYPTVRLIAESSTPVSTQVDSRKLSAVYTAGPFSDRDRRLLAADLSYAYRRLCESAAAASVALQPCLARYRIVDSTGRIACVSAPVLLTHPSGAQCVDAVSLYSADGQTVDGYTLRADTWHLRIELPENDAVDAVRLDVMMTPLFHPFDSGAESSVVPGRRNSAADVFARVALPGRSGGLGKAFGATARRMVFEALARMEALERCVASVHNPFREATRSIIPDVSFEPDPMRDRRAISEAMSAKMRIFGRNEVLLASPHSFSARNVAAGASAYVWSGIRALPFRGYSADTFAAAHSSASWRSVTAVRLQGNKGVVRSDQGSTGAFSAVGPLICYPLPDAREMTLTVFDGTTTRSGIFPLTPDPSGRYAVYLSDDLLPVELKATSAAAAVDFGDAAEELPEVVAFAPLTAPLSVCATAQLADEPKAVFPRAPANQAWDYGRSRFIAATRSRIYSLVLGSGGSKVTVNTLLERGIARCDALTPGDSGDFYAVASLPTSDIGTIVRVSASGNVAAVDDTAAYSALACSSGYGELWAVGADGTLTVIPRSGKYAYRRDDIAVESFVVAGGEIFAVSGDYCYEIGREIERRSVAVEACSRYELPQLRRRKVRAVEILMQGSSVTGEIRVTATSVGHLRDVVLRRASLSGVCAGPLRIPVVFRGIRAVETRFAGRVSPDFVIRPQSVVRLEAD